MSKPGWCPQRVWDDAIKCAETVLRNLDQDDVKMEVELIARAILSAEQREREASAVAGWNACRRSIYAVCEDVIEEYEQHRSDADNAPRHHFGRGGMSAAKSIARGFNSMEALDDDNLTTAIRNRGTDND